MSCRSSAASWRPALRIVSLALTAILAPVVIAIAWFWYRPLVSVVVLAVGLGIAYGFKRRARRSGGTQSGAAGDGVIVR